MKIDIHQHLWTEPLVQALAAARRAAVRASEHGLTVLYLAGERPFVLDLAAESPARRAALVDARRSRPRARVPVEPAGDRVAAARAGDAPARRLPRRCAGTRRPLRRVGRARARPARSGRRRPTCSIGAASASRCPRARWPASSRSRVCAPMLARLESRGAPLLVHPGPGPGSRTRSRARAVAGGPALVAGPDAVRRRDARRLAGVARRRSRRASPATHPLHDARRPRSAAHERLASRGGPLPTSRPIRSRSTTPPHTARRVQRARRARRSRAAAVRLGPSRRRARPLPRASALGWDLRADGTAARSARVRLSGPRPAARRRAMSTRRLSQQPTARLPTARRSTPGAPSPRPLR